MGHSPPFLFFKRLALRLHSSLLASFGPGVDAEAVVSFDRGWCPAVTRSPKAGKAIAAADREVKWLAIGSRWKNNAEESELPPPPPSLRVVARLSGEAEPWVFPASASALRLGGVRIAGGRGCQCSASRNR